MRGAEWEDGGDRNGDALKKISKEVSEEMEEQRRRADELERRVKANREIHMQEQAQITLEKETERTRLIAEARADIEMRVREQHEMAEGVGAVPLGAMAASAAISPTFGPTGQRLDEQQLQMLHAARPRQAEQTLPGAEMEVADIPRVRRTRWEAQCNDSEGLPAAFRGNRRWLQADENEPISRRERSPRLGNASSRIGNAATAW